MKKTKAVKEDPIIIKTEIATEEDILLQSLKERFFLDSLNMLTEGAKQVIVIAPIIISVFTFGSHKIFSNNNTYYKLLIVPITFLILSVIASIISIIPKHVLTSTSELSDFKKLLQSRIRRKFTFVIIAYVCLVSSLCAMGILFLIQIHLR